MRSVYSAIILGLSLIIAFWIAGAAFKYRSKVGETIVVTGLLMQSTARRRDRQRAGHRAGQGSCPGAGSVSSPPGRNDALDGLRGVAALVVVFWHIACVLAPAAAFGFRRLPHSPAEITIFDSPLWVLLNGNFAVVVFFALSGYVLTADHFRQPDHARLAMRLIGRFVRLALPAGLSILLVYALQALDLYAIGRLAQQIQAEAGVVFDTPFGIDFSPVSLFRSMLFTTWFRLPDFSNSYNLVLWTMPIELWGSYLVLSLALVLRDVRYRALLLCMVAAVIVSAVPGHIGVYLGTFVLGSALAASRSPLPGPIGSLGWLIVAFAALLLGSHHGSAPETASKILHIQSEHAVESLYMRSLGAVLLVAAVVHSQHLAGLLSTRPCRFLGRISFALYLLHQPILYSIGAYVALTFDDATQHLERVFIVGIVVLSLSLPAAALFQRWIDRPSTNLARRLAEHLFRGKPRSASVQLEGMRG